LEILKAFLEINGVSYNKLKEKQPELKLELSLTSDFERARMQERDPILTK
jgi:hypothetical protein